MTELESQLEGSISLAQRINQLERQCAVLAAEVDAQWLVIEAARDAANAARPTAALMNLRRELRIYDRRHEAAKEQG